MLAAFSSSTFADNTERPLFFLQIDASQHALAMGHAVEDD